MTLSRHWLTLCAVGCLVSGCTVRTIEEVEVVPPGTPRPGVLRTSPYAPAPPDQADLHPVELLSDEVVASAVRRRLASLAGTPTQKSPSMEVSVDRGIVILTGRVRTGLHAQLAVQEVQAVRGVRGVVNRLEIQPTKVPDAEIETRIRARFVEDPAVEEFEIEAHSQGGRVRIDGLVHSFTEKEIASDLAWSVPGVIAVENEILVVPRERRADAEIRADITARLARDAFLHDAPVRVGVESGAVTLSGVVGSAMEKLRARTHAWVTGVRVVEDDLLRVEPSRRAPGDRVAAPSLSENQIADAVRDALRFDPRVPEDGISLDVEAGIVRLEGSVPDLMSKRAAEQDAANTVGVWRVESDIIVAPPQPLSDAALISRIRQRLTENADLDVRKIVLKAEDGRVVLRGEAESRLESLLIARTVERTPGVRAVTNELQIMQPLAAVRDDAMLERDIETALWWDPRVDSSDVNVEVRDSVAIVTGTVPNQAVHEAVLEAVWRARPQDLEDRLRRAEE